ncbi:MAG: ROK family protein [Betaproteobacteria bacterium]|nr:ROK family protein [Betaproteobacteria bacterium]
MRFGIDLGGTKIEIIALSADGRQLLRRRAATPQGDYDATLATVASLVRETDAATGQRGAVGICTPGALSPVTGLLRNSNSTCLNGRPIKADLERRLGREIRIANDANCFALSEAVDGAGSGADIVFGVILGTGVGGGIVVRGRVLDGANAIAGEWGHNPLPFCHRSDEPPPACYCGRHGCIETYLSGPGMAADHLRTSGESRMPEQVVAGAEAGEPACVATVERYQERLARALAQVINVIDPQVIVLGGGLSNIGSLYEAVPRLWRPYVFSDHVATRLVRNLHGDSSGVRGAAWLWSPDEVPGGAR